MLYIKRSMVSGILAFGLLSGGPPAVQAKSWSKTTKNGTSLEGTSTGQTLTQGALFVQTAGRALTVNQTVKCDSATTKVGSFQVTNLNTGGSLYVPGIGSYGPISITGNDLVVRSGSGLSVGAAAALWIPDPATGSGTINWAGGVLTSVSVPTGVFSATLPDGMTPEGLFDQVMGVYARRGYTFSKSKTARSSLTPTRYYTNGTVSLSINGATASGGAGAMGIMLSSGQWIAVITAGAASYGTYVPQ